MAAIDRFQLTRVCGLGQLLLLLGFIWMGLCPLPLAAHPMPNSLLQLKVGSKQIHADLQIPLSELMAAWGLQDEAESISFLERYEPSLRQYLRQHFRPKTLQGQKWRVQVGDIDLLKTQNPINGAYSEIHAELELIPPKGADLRHFKLYYDVVVHQVVTHTIMVSTSQNLAKGKTERQLGTIQLDIPSGKILPLEVQLEKADTWASFSRMFQLGKEHIAAGTDHLLFLLAMLLPAPLLHSGRRWGAYGGLRYSLVRLLKVVSAFTLGHSLTLLIATLRWLNLPVQPIEILIAFSILVSAIHAFRPVFAGKELWIALIFGLIHGLAFAETLQQLDLDTPQLLLSLLGFNLGIEWMQLGIIGLCLPALLLLSQCAVYPLFRTLFAALVAIAAFAWMLERIAGQANFLTSAISSGIIYAPGFLIGMTLMAIGLYWREHKSSMFKLQNLKS